MSKIITFELRTVPEAKSDEEKMAISDAIKRQVLRLDIDSKLASTDTNKD